MLQENVIMTSLSTKKPDGTGFDRNGCILSINLKT
jgi:hypothetical protein